MAGDSGYGDRYTLWRVMEGDLVQRCMDKSSNDFSQSDASQFGYGVYDVVCEGEPVARFYVQESAPPTPAYANTYSNTPTYHERPGPPVYEMSYEQDVPREPKKSWIGKMLGILLIAAGLIGLFLMLTKNDTIKQMLGMSSSEPQVVQAPPPMKEVAYVEKPWELSVMDHFDMLDRFKL